MPPSSLQKLRDFVLSRLRRTDHARVAFQVSVALMAILAPFLIGLYSAHAKNFLYRAIYGLYTDLETAFIEIPNMTHWRPIHFLVPAHHDGDGVTVNAAGAKSDDLILLSGFFEDDNGVRLMRRDGTVLASWRLRMSELLPAGQCRLPPATDWNAIPHGTIIDRDGSVIFSFESCGMVKLDRCGKTVWTTPQVTHHSPNFLENGGIVIAGAEHVSENIPWPFKGPYWEDLVYKFSRDGKLLFRKPATEIFLKNGMAPAITSTGRMDPVVGGEFHLNEVEELSSALAPDFPMFEAGDLMLSFRNLNLVMVTDANAERVKWWRTGPWERQHDPDFEPGGKITVFDNLSQDAKHSRIVEIDPRTGISRVLYGEREGEQMFSKERATHQMQPGGGILITEAQAGRAFEVDANGRIIWEWINRYDKDSAAWMADAEIYPAGYFRVADWSCR